MVIVINLLKDDANLTFTDLDLPPSMIQDPLIALTSRLKTDVQ